MLLCLTAGVCVSVCLCLCVFVLHFSSPFTLSQVLSQYLISTSSKPKVIKEVKKDIWKIHMCMHLEKVLSVR